MIAYMKKHEKYVSERLLKNLGQEELAELLSYHDKQITWMQHERLIHLIVTLFVCLFTLLALGFAFYHTSWPAWALGVILLILSTAYLIHYFRLENGVQQWYEISKEIRRKLS